MKRIILLLLFTFSILFFGLSIVNAKDNYSFANSSEFQYFADSSSTQCKALLGDPSKSGSVAYYLQFILDIIKYAGIVLCIFLTTVDFAKALLGDDRDMHKSLAKKAFARLIYAVMLFFLPIIVKAFLMLIDVYGTCGIG